jgi:hypothetical protein
LLIDAGASQKYHAHFYLRLQPDHAAPALGAALNETLMLHSTLCRREAGALQKALQSGEDVVVARIPETRLFAALGQQAEGATRSAEPLQASASPPRGAAEHGDSVSSIKFVNIREAGGWSLWFQLQHACAFSA